MKLIIQIPCFNESETLAETLAVLPRNVEGFDTVEILVVDDGSTDGTADIARANGVDHVVQLDHNSGLAMAFMAGLEAAVRADADVIVNTDADNQYDARAIPALTRPILEGTAQIVVGARPISEIEHFTPVKRMLQKAGSAVVRLTSGLNVPDAPSGFRAIHRNAALQLFVFNRYTYTLETLIQAGKLGLPVVSVDVAVNLPTRPSRLVKSNLDYVLKSAMTILRVFVLYRPLRVFAVLAMLFFIPGFIAFARFFILWSMGEGAGKIQSLVIGGAFIASAFVLLVGGLIADLVAANRMLLAEIRGRQLQMSIELDKK